MASEHRRDLFIINTGDGKGKSSSAFGVMLRALARGWRVKVIQFIKSESWKTGEKKMADQLGVEWVIGGDGFTWESNDMEATAQAASDAWQVAKDSINSGTHELIILDEVTYPITFGWIEVADVVETIANRPTGVNVIVTGRDAHEDLIAIADTVTEMRKIKHPFDQGVAARKGIDF